MLNNVTSVESRTLHSRRNRIIWTDTVDFLCFRSYICEQVITSFNVHERGAIEAYLK